MKRPLRPADLLFWLWTAVVALDIVLQESQGIAWYWTAAGISAWFGLGWLLGRAQAATGRSWFWLALLAWSVSTLLGLIGLLARRR